MIHKQKKSEVQSIERQSIIQLIVFRAGEEEFGVPIDVIREIIKMNQITSIPASPDYIKGILNVRGEIVTAVDMRIRFKLPFNPKTEAKHIIVTKQADGLFGLIVDEVIEVLRIFESEIQPPPQLITQIHKKYVTGVVTNNDRLIIILDLSHILSQKDLVQFSSSLKNKKNNMLNNHIDEIKEIINDSREPNENNTTNENISTSDKKQNNE